MEQTFYPDAHTETATVDGNARHNDTAVDFSVLTGGAGTDGYDSLTYGAAFYIEAASTTNKWNSLYRSIYLFDTAALGSDVTITGAVLSVYGISKSDLSGFAPNVNVYSSNPASDTAIASGDFDSLGTTELATSKAFADLAVGGYCDFTLNAAGLAAINKTGITKLGLRNANYDVANTPPSWVSGAWTLYSVYFSEQGTGYKPKIVVTYTSKAKSATGSASASLSASGYLRGRQAITGIGAASLSASGYLRGVQSISGGAAASVSASALVSFPVPVTGSADAVITARATLSGANTGTVSGLMGKY
jgi:hypothetical protein